MQKNEFVTKIIVNIAIRTRLNKNVSKISFLDVNVSNFLLNENTNIFLLEVNVNNFFRSKYQYVPLEKNVEKLSLLEENVNNFLLNLNMSMFLLD